MATRQRLAEAQGLLRQAGVRPNPTLEVQGGTGRPLGTKGEEEFSAGYFQPLETGGKRSKRQRIAELGVELAKAELDERSRQLSFEVKTKAIDTIIKSEKSKALQKLANVNQQAYQLTQARVQEGDVPALDAQLLLVEQNRAEAQFALLTGQLKADLADLRRTLGLGPEDEIALGQNLRVDSRDPSLSALKQMALATRPDLRTLQLLEAQGDADFTLATAQSSPDITVSARYVHKNSAFDQLGLSSTGSPVPLRDKDDVIVLGASIPLFTASRNRGNIEASAARAKTASLRKQQFAFSIPLEVEAAYQRWKAAKDTLAIYDRGIVTQAAKNLDVIRQAYQLGQLRLLDVLNEQRKFTDTELAYIDAKADLVRAVSELEKVIGGNLP